MSCRHKWKEQLKGTYICTHRCIKCKLVRITYPSLGWRSYLYPNYIKRIAIKLTKGTEETIII